MGAMVAVFVLILATTGLLLNHTTDWQLDQRYITWDWVLKQYGLTSVQPDVSYQLGRSTVSQFDEQVFIDAVPAYRSVQPVLGGVHIDDLIVLATEQGLLLFTPEGEFIEQMSEEAGVPSHIQNIGLSHGDPIIQTREGMRRTDFMLDQWEDITLQAVSWSQPEPLPADIEQQLAHYFHGKGISVERLVLDIHNGHIVTKYGVWLLDVVSVLLILLSLTGLYLWLRQQVLALRSKLKKHKKVPLEEL